MCVCVCGVYVCVCGVYVCVVFMCVYVYNTVKSAESGVEVGRSYFQDGPTRNT